MSSFEIMRLADERRHLHQLVRAHLAASAPCTRDSIANWLREQSVVPYDTDVTIREMEESGQITFYDNHADSYMLESE